MSLLVAHLRDLGRTVRPGAYTPTAFDDAYATRAEKHATTSLSQEEQQWILHALGGARPKCIVDVGCNTGMCLDRFCQHFQADGIGIDCNGAALARARSALPRYTFLHAVTPHLPLGDASVDHVSLHHTIAHLPRPHDTLAEIHRILRPGGTLSVITTNRLYKILQWPRNVMTGFPLDETVLRHYSVHTLLSDLEKGGFRIGTTSLLGPLPAHCPHALRAYAPLRLCVLAIRQ